MNEVAVNKKDQILMQLAHYFITQENYTPILVRGVQNEIWLENIEAPYKIIRINSNYIHNNEQLDFDLLKIKNVVKQVKKKTFSFRIKTLNIVIDPGTNVDLHSTDKIDCIFINSTKGIKKSNEINNLFPDLKANLLDTSDGIEFLLNVTNDINLKTEKENREFEKVFKKKKISVTYILIFINVLIYIVGTICNYLNYDLFSFLALNKYMVKGGEAYRLITAAFTHMSPIHLLMNVYALYIIGSQVETFIGKWRYTIVYLYSAVIGCLLSCVVNNGWSLGASGAIFGLLGSLCYFGYHYRLYLDNALRTQIIPLIILNLTLGFMMPGVIDNAGHIGGLIGGIFMSVAVGLENKSTKTEQINGIICSTIALLFFIYLVFFK